MNKLITTYQKFLASTGIITDTRKLKEGCLFMALKGPRFNGNEFAAKALDNGATYAIIDEQAYEVPGDDRYILVEDSLVFLQDLARHHRRQFEIPIIAITGSNGKTTTKELVATVMNSTYRTQFTQGNLNNHIGVPLTLLTLKANTEVAIIEMGANHQGEIAELCCIAEPTHGLITNIGKAHLAGFGGPEGVKKGKGELFDYLAKNGGVAFVNRDEDHLVEMAEKIRHKIYYLQCDQPNMEVRDYEIKLIAEKPLIKAAFLSPDGRLITTASQLIGRYNFNNLMTAIAFGKYFKVTPDQISKSIASYVPSNNRGQLVKRNSNTFILDAYNANPSSVLAALQHFLELSTKNKVVILGDMLELGNEGLVEHQQIIDQLENAELAQIILVGPIYGKTSSKVAQIRHFTTVEDLKEWFNHQSFSDTCFLLKGSRGIGLEKLLLA